MKPSVLLSVVTVMVSNHCIRRGPYFVSIIKKDSRPTDICVLFYALYMKGMVCPKLKFKLFANHNFVNGGSGLDPEFYGHKELPIDAQGDGDRELLVESYFKRYRT